MPPKGRRPRRDGWASMKRELLERQAPGPSSFLELCNWPMMIADGIGRAGTGKKEADDEMLLRLRTILQNGIVVVTDYSGIGTGDVAVYDFILFQFNLCFVF